MVLIHIYIKSTKFWLLVCKLDRTTACRSTQFCSHGQSECLGLKYSACIFFFTTLISYSFVELKLSIQVLLTVSRAHWSPVDCWWCKCTNYGDGLCYSLYILFPCQIFVLTVHNICSLGHIIAKCLSACI